MSVPPTKRYKRVKRVENKDWIGVDGGTIGPFPDPDPGTTPAVTFVRTEDTITTLNADKWVFPEHSFVRTNDTITATEV